MISPTLEIKVAILGYVSVGKTTVLNALLQEKFSEVSMRRTTAGVNFFKIISPLSNSKTEQQGGDELHGREKGEPHRWAPPVDDEPVRSAASTLVEITKDNEKLRKEKVIQEKTFNIHLEKHFFEMHKDTTLVFVDIPGLNEADSKKMYLNYVTNNWDTFDCVIIVLDASKGVNTEEDVELLKFAKRMLVSKKDIPLIILCNKVDDPEDKELRGLVGEVQKKVEKIFSVTDRTESLKQLLVSLGEGKRCSEPVSPVFIPLSAGNAFAYRTAANCSFETFQQLDSSIVDKLGRNEVGVAKWKRLSQDEKYKVAFGAVSNPSEYQDLLEGTNFDKLLGAFCYCVGGNDVQRDLLAKQIAVSLCNLPRERETLLAHQLRSIYERCKVLNQDTNRLKVAFWNEYAIFSRVAYKHLSSKPDIASYNKTVHELIAYRDFVRQVGWLEEEGKVMKKMVHLVRDQIGIILEREGGWKIDGSVIARFSNCYEWNGNDWQRSNSSNRSAFVVDSKRNDGHSLSTFGSYSVDEWWLNSSDSASAKPPPPANYPWHWKYVGGDKGWQNVYTHEWRQTVDNPVAGALTWKTLTYHDWATIIGSLLLMASNRHFAVQFGREKMELERLLLRHNLFSTCLAPCETNAEKAAQANIKSFSKGSFASGSFIPTDALKYGFVRQVVAPSMISDPSHWGYVIWTYCNLMDTMDVPVAALNTHN